MRNPLIQQRATLVLGFFLVSCVPDPVPPPAPSDLEERNRALEELKSQLDFMKQATPNQLQGLLDHSDFRVRARAARRLGQLGAGAIAGGAITGGAITGGASEALPSLHEKLNDESREVRIETTMALSAIGDATSINPLMETLVDRERKVRFWGWKAIRQFGADAYPILVQNLMSDSPLANRSYVDESGTRITFQTELRNRLVALGQDIIPPLTKSLDERNASIQTDIIKTLAGMGKNASKALPSLADALGSSEDKETQIEIIRAMKKIGDLDPVVIPSLSKAALSPDDKVAKEAQRALKKLK